MDDTTTAGTRRPSPETARRELAGRVARARQRAGHTQLSMARELGWSIRKQQLLESGDQILADRELEALLPGLAVPEDEWPDWQALVVTAHEPGWWDAYDDEDLSPVAKRYAGLEHGARRIRTFEPLVIPALLQTDAYRAEVVAGTAVLPPPAEQVRALVEVGRRRQRLLTAPDPVHLAAVLDEAALHRRVGLPGVMRDQLRHLADLGETRPNVTVRVIPFGAGPHAGLTGPFALLDFGVPGDHGLVRVEAVPDIPTYLERRRDVYAYSRVFERLEALALSTADSRVLLRERAG